MPKAWKLVLYEKKIKVFTSLFGNADRNFTLEAGRPGFATLPQCSVLREFKLRKPTRIGKDRKGVKQGFWSHRLWIEHWEPSAQNWPRSSILLKMFLKKDIRNAADYQTRIPDNYWSIPWERAPKVQGSSGGACSPRKFPWFLNHSDRILANFILLG